MSDYLIEAATKEEWAERALIAEAKLAKALEVLREIDIGQSTMPDHWEYRCMVREKARAARAELRGEK